MTYFWILVTFDDGHIAKLPLPFWLEGALFADPYRSKGAGVADE